jgi:hypothetical protein
MPDLAIDSNIVNCIYQLLKEIIFYLEDVWKRKATNNNENKYFFQAMTIN